CLVACLSCSVLRCRWSAACLRRGAIGGSPCCICMVLRLACSVLALRTTRPVLSSTSSGFSLCGLVSGYLKLFLRTVYSVALAASLLRTAGRRAAAEHDAKHIEWGQPSRQAAWHALSCAARPRR